MNQISIAWTKWLLMIVVAHFLTVQELVARAAYPIQVRGQVSSTSGPLFGVNVLLSGTTTPVQTGADGRYVINNVLDGSSLRFYAEGYETQDIPVNSRTEINVVLKQIVDRFALTTPTLSNYSLTVGGSVQVTFNWKNPAYIDPARKYFFNIVLSTPDGKFDLGEKLLGRVSSPGTHSVQIPAVAPGTGYRILIRYGEEKKPCPDFRPCAEPEILDSAPTAPITIRGLTVNPVYDCQKNTLLVSATGGDGSLIEYKVKEYVDRYLATNTFLLSQTVFGGKSVTIYVRQKGVEYQQIFTIPLCSGAKAPLTLQEPIYNCQQQTLTVVTNGGDRSKMEYKVLEYGDKYYPSNIFLLPRGQYEGKNIHVFARQSGTEYQKIVTVPVCPARPEVSPSGRAAATAESRTSWYAALGENPVADQVRVTLVGAQGQLMHLSLMTESGKVVADRVIRVTSDQQQEQLSLGSQPAGLYILQVAGVRQAVTHKVLKQ